jgi:putative ABC transport system permease protein
MLSIISWRNVWRSKGRSIVVIGAIVLGISALSFAFAFMRSFMQIYIDNAINSQYGHVQMHHPEFTANKDVEFTIEDANQLVSALRENERVASVSPRMLLSGMANTATGTSGVQILGIEPGAESKVFKLDKSIIEGSYFEEVKRNPILVGKDLAEKLDIKVKSKLVLTFTDDNGDLTSAAFRIDGIFDTNSPIINQAGVFVKQNDLKRLLGSAMIHEIVLRLENPENLQPVTNQLSAKFEKLKVQNWKELAPELELITTQTSTVLLIIMVIIMLALGFGIVNTMLMAVLERMKEIGMLMAIGMNKVRVFFMIVLETIMLALIGGPIGLLLGFAIIKHFQHYGFDLADYAKGLDKFGFDTTVYPVLEPQYYFYLAAGVIIIAVLGAIYPAIKAIKLKPVEAINKI